jgi:hypothetical protein
MQNNNLETLSLEDFSNRLNKGVFKVTALSQNLLTQEQFEKAYPDVVLYSKESLAKFVSDLVKTKDKKAIQKGMSELNSIHSKRIVVLDSENTPKVATIFFSDLKNRIIPENDKFLEIQKGVLDNALLGNYPEETLEKAINTFEPDELEGDDIEKALMDSFRYDEKNRFKKKGKDIKERIGKLKSKLEGKISELKRRLDHEFEELSIKPTVSCTGYYAGSDCCIEDFGMDYKCFPYESVYYDDNVKSNSALNLGGGLKAASSKEESQLRREWNELCRQLLSMCVDLKTADVLSDAMEDSKEYELTITQLQSLGFGL